MKQILKDAFKSDELQDHLVNVIAQDDGVDVEELDNTLIVNEARYVLSKYIDGSKGFMQHDEYVGEAGPDLQKEAKRNVTVIRKFLQKHGA